MKALRSWARLIPRSKSMEQCVWGSRANPDAGRRERFAATYIDRPGGIGSRRGCSRQNGHAVMKYTELSRYQCSKRCFPSRYSCARADRIRKRRIGSIFPNRVGGALKRASQQQRWILTRIRHKAKLFCVSSNIGAFPARGKAGILGIFPACQTRCRFP